MKPTETQRNDAGKENPNIGGLFLLLSVIAILSFTVLLWRADWFSQKPVDKGAVQETLGYRIQAMVQFDLERQAYLKEEWNRTVRKFTAFVNGRDERQQEILGQSIVGMTQRILLEKKRLRGAVVQAKEELRLFNEGRKARLQENLGGAVMKAYRRAPEGGLAFQLAFERETIRLGKIEARTSLGLQSTVSSLTAREAGFQSAIPGMYRDAIESAQRSAVWIDASYMATAGRILHTLNADLSWQRQPEDYIQMAGGVREILGDGRSVGGFLEYGWAALIGLLAAMTWMGMTIPKGPSADVETSEEDLVIDFRMPKAA